MTLKNSVVEGGCDCGHIRYEVTMPPLFVHCCHCTWCQRESGSAFAINGLIESAAVTLTHGEPVLIDVPTASGGGQQFVRCPKCMVALWSHYISFSKAVAFIKVGTLDDPNQMTPDIHIFTRSKQAWLELPKQVPAYQKYYNRKELWPKGSLARLNKVIQGAQE